MILKVYNFNRLAGCDVRLIDFFSWWQTHGPFPVTIPEFGGKRIDEQLQTEYYAKGRTTPGPHAGEPGYPELGLTVTGAKTLKDTPHGRGGAVDSYPAIISSDYKVTAILNNEKDPKTLEMFARYGSLAKTYGLEWGGVWKDYPHVQCPNWREISFTSQGVA